MATASPRHRSLSPRLVRWREQAAERPLLVLVGLLIVLMLITNLVSPGFLFPGNLSTTLLIAGPMGMLAAGQTVVILTGGIDLSTTGTATIAAYFLAQYSGSNGILAVLGALGIGAAIGLVNGIGVGPFGVAPLIMTLGMSGIITGLLTVWAANTSNTPVIPDAIRQAGSGKWLTYIPIDVVLWGGLTVILLVLLRGSGFGRAVYAVGANPVASRLAGVRNWQVLLAVYTLCGLLSAAAGILLAGYAGAVDTSLATTYLLPSVAAVVIGGTSILGGSGGYAGSIVGVLILTVLESLLILMNIAEALRQVLYGVIVLGLAWIYARAASGD
ncbi:MAG TPA: ABC transporter permease [Chloroflexota bacterium]|nr:ABC transporter permease [Chloroflexota bacterium]